MLEPLLPSSTFERCAHELARALDVDEQPRSHEDRLLLVQYFAALVIGGRIPVHAHDGLGNTALHYAARIGWAAGVSSILQMLDGSDESRTLWDGEEREQELGRGAAAAVARKNASGCSALHCASVSGCLRTLHVLLQFAGNSIQDGDAWRDESQSELGIPSGAARDHVTVDNGSRTLLHYAGAERAKLFVFWALTFSGQRQRMM